MEQCILRLTLITEGATEKVSQFIMPLKLVYNKNLCFNYIVDVDDNGNGSS